MLTENEKKRIAVRLEELEKELTNVKLSESATATVGASCRYPDFFAEMKKIEREMTLLKDTLGTSNRRHVTNEIARVESVIKMIKSEMKKHQDWLDTFSDRLKNNEELLRFLEDFRSRLFP